MGQVRYRVYCWAFAVGSLIHLTLPDALQWSWLLPNLCYWVGLAIVAWRGSLLGWALCAVGLFVPLALLGDQLTQSAFLLICSATVIGFWFGPKESRERRLNTHLPRTIGLLTVGTYLIAVFHKVNRDFFDPEVSCANGGVSILADNWNLGWLEGMAASPGWPILFAVTEVAVVVLFLRRVQVGILLALLLHIPLTIIFAPAFAFTMISGWVCLLSEKQLLFLKQRFIERWPWIVGLGLALGALSFALYMQRHWVVYAYWSIKEAVLWVGVVWILFSWRGFPAREPNETPLPRLTWAVLGLWLINGLLPYSGIKFHHSGAMLSNLRVDEGCWNSYLVPEGARVFDPDSEAPWWARGVARQQVNRAQDCPQACIH